MTADPSSGSKNRSSMFTLLLVGASFLLLSYTGYSYLRNRTSSNGAHSSVAKVVASEELLLQLTRRVAALSKSAMNLSVPDHNSLDLFQERIVLEDLVEDEVDAGELVDEGIVRRDWRVADTDAEVSREGLELLRPLLGNFKYFDHAKFYLVRGSFPDTDFNTFETEMGFVATGVLRQGSRRAVHGTQTVVWRRPATPNKTDHTETGGTLATNWQIASWKVEHVTTEDTHKLVFEEVLERVLPDRQSRIQARQSIHEQLLTPFLTETKLPVKYYTPYFSPDSLGKHPSVSVVDINRDGFDDIYLMDRWSRNMLFVNQGDATFREEAAQWGLDVERHSTGAIFADFDNDGDPDLLLGRSLAGSKYLVNEQGKFVDRTEQLIDGRLPALVTAVSAADVNADGLLDVYFTTYSVSLLSERLFGEVRDPDAKPWPDEFLTPEEAARMKDLAASAHRILDQVGPPNVLLINQGGGRFKSHTEGPTQVWRSSLQGSFADFDDDGDADLYVANDFAPDSLFRNDGTGKFEDVSNLLGVDNMSAGMGASWGDFDNDGRQDLYVSNMYSKAGLRIVAQVPELDRRYLRFAEGNSLFRNTGEAFENVAGLTGDTQRVAKAGWSWGGQLFDLDNDTDLDIYVSSGYYTVPPTLATGVDL